MLAVCGRFARHLLRKPLPTQLQLAFAFLLFLLLKRAESCLGQRDGKRGQQILLGPVILSNQICFELFGCEFAQLRLLHSVLLTLLQIGLNLLFELIYLFSKRVPSALELLILLDELVMLLVVIVHAVEDCLVCFVFEIALVELSAYLIQLLLQSFSHSNFLFLVLLGAGFQFGLLQLWLQLFRLRWSRLGSHVFFKLLFLEIEEEVLGNSESLYERRFTIF